MNNVFLFLLGIFLCCSCKKDSPSDNRPDVTSEYTAKLVGKWKAIAQISDIPIDAEGDGTASTDLYTQWITFNPYHYRGIWEFKSDKTGTAKWAAYTISSPGSTTTYPAITWGFNWRLEDKGYLLAMDITSVVGGPSVSKYQFDIAQVTDTTIIEKHNAEIPQGSQIIKYVETTTYKKQ